VSTQDLLLDELDVGSDHLGQQVSAFLHGLLSNGHKLLHSKFDAVVNCLGEGIHKDTDTLCVCWHSSVSEGSLGITDSSLDIRHMDSSCVLDSGDGSIKTRESVCKVNDELVEASNGLHLYFFESLLNRWVEIKVVLV